MSYMDELNFWLNDDYFDQKTKDELLAIRNNEAEVEDRFYKELEFGTGGLRGVIGAGTNRMNVYTVRKATQGLANYIIKRGTQSKGVAIAFDSRRMSPEFSDEAARCLAANGIKAYIFESLRPTPELSFALRTLGCTAGIVVTASHNPPEYNGYKVYWEDGAQVTAPIDKDIITEVQAIKDYHTVKTMSREDAEKAGLYQVIGKEIDDKYMAELKKQIIHPDVIQEMADDIKIVYTPLCGTGNKPVRRILSELGFKHVYVVPEQENPDPNFTTLDYPNPEDPKAFTYALRLAKEKDADIVLATDPDADRLGVYAKDTKTGEYVAFTGNMSGMLIAEYILREKTATGAMPENPALVTTIVTTNMTKPITEAYGVKLIEVLTGFKFIGEQIGLLEAAGEADRYIFGFEESYGYLSGAHVRDKDAVNATLLVCEAAAWYAKQGMTLLDAINKLYAEFGCYRNALHSFAFEGESGMHTMDAIMKQLRQTPPTAIGGMAVESVLDYNTEGTGLPKANVLEFRLAGGAKLMVRPSGTEPKIKVYLSAVAPTEAAADAINDTLGKAAAALLKA